MNHFSLFAVAEKTKTAVGEIIEEITKSYSEASKTFLGLLAWWMLVFILLTAIVLAFILIISPIAVEFKEYFINANFIKLNHQLKNNNAVRKTI